MAVVATPVSLSAGEVKFTVFKLELVTFKTTAIVCVFELEVPVTSIL